MTTTLITGASSGIGWDLAKLFAADADDLVLVARSTDSLEQLAHQVSVSYGVTATVLPFDLSRPDAVDRLCQTLNERGIKIDCLVNNAGFGALGKFATLSADTQTDMIMVNVVALTRLTRNLLPGMLQRDKGGVLNVGSIAAYQAGPNMSVYYATKAYVLSFSEGLREEVSDSNLHVTCLAPGPTETGFGASSGMNRLKMFTSNSMPAAQVAKIGHRGFRKNQAVVIPGWRNRLMVAVTGLLPRSWTRKFVKKIQPVDPQR